MPRHKSSVNVGPGQFPAHEARAGIFPDRVVDVNNWSHQGDKSKARFDNGQQSADPGPVTGSENAQCATTACPQCGQQLSELDYCLTQSLGIADQIRGNGQFTMA